MKTVFVVDDGDTNRVALKAALDNDYKTFALPSAERMFEMLKKKIPDIILLDIEMPGGMDGFEALKVLKSTPEYKSIPVIFLTANNSAEVEVRGFNMGVVDFIAKPFTAPVLIRRIESHIETEKIIKYHVRALTKLHNATISVIANLVESRDNITGRHVERTQGYLMILIDEMLRIGLYKEELASWDMGILLPSAQLHDVGKIVISDTVLNKPDRLTPEEFEQIKRHSSEGERIINEIIEKTEEDSFLIHAKRFASSHHEKWNGTGYPHKLAGLDIPLEGRIMAYADVYDALVSERPYKKAFSHEKATEIILSDAGTHFDPNIAQAFENVSGDFWGELLRFQYEGKA